MSSPAPGIIEPDWPAPPQVLAFTTTRSGGASAPPFDRFNLGDHVGDDAAAVRENRRRLAQLLPHGAAVAWLEQFRDQWSGRLDRLDSLLHELKHKE